MKFSSRSEYGLRAMVSLAKSYPEKKTIAKISQEEKISQKYLERLMGQFRRSGIIKSLKGKNGGYVLARRPEQIKAGEILEIIEGSLAPMKCSEAGCSLQKKCQSWKVWFILGQQIRKTLFGITLKELIS